MRSYRILLIGQCTLHLGRMEHGNIGNYYIIEPLVRQLHRVFPNADIRTTFQMTDDFCKREKITRLPIELYYAWKKNDLDDALQEIEIANTFYNTGNLKRTTPYIKEVLASDIVIDFSGDMWGDNANFLGPNRFIVGAYKDYIAHLLRKTVVMVAGSPGPFNNPVSREIGQKVFDSFDLITNREAESRKVLVDSGFQVHHATDLACPAFLFEGSKGLNVNSLLKKEGLRSESKPVVGFILCGWNFQEGPFDKCPRDEDEYDVFVDAIEHIVLNLDCSVCLLSHSNGFKVPPIPLELFHGRDYPIIKQLLRTLKDRGRAQNVFSLDGIYSPWDIKAIIGNFDMVVSGRIHAAVAALSQNVPTVIIDYGHEPKAHKLKGFADVTGVTELLGDPSNSSDLIAKITSCWNSRIDWQKHLSARIPKVQDLARKNFDLIKDLVP